MAVNWLSEFVSFFRPEESPRFSDEKYFQGVASQSANKKSLFSVKALFWIVISILLGLTIGQLC